MRAMNNTMYAWLDLGANMKQSKPPNLMISGIDCASIMSRQSSIGINRFTVGLWMWGCMGVFVSGIYTKVTSSALLV